MKIEESQKDMRSAYFGGAVGILVSGFVWVVAGIVATSFSKFVSIAVFFFGGMLIVPVSILILKWMGRTGKHQENNPLGKLGMESTAILFIGLFIAYCVFQIQPTWFFPIMLMMIGGRYLVFQSIYGIKIFWALGIILSALGMVLLLFNPPFYIPALVGGITELIFGFGIIQSEKNNSK